MPIIGSQIINQEMGGTGGPSTIDFSADANDLALVSLFSVASLIRNTEFKAASMALTSSGVAALSVNGTAPTTLQTTALALESEGVAGLDIERKLATDTTALDSSGSLANPEPVRALSVAAPAFDSSGSLVDLRFVRALSVATAALDSSGSFANLQLVRALSVAAPALTSTSALDLTSFTFTPDTISSLALWLDAGVGVTTNGSNEVTEWADQSGNNRDFTPNTGEEPSYNATDSNFNNKSSLEFDAATAFTSGDSLRYTGGAIIGDGTQAAAKFFVVRPEAHPASTALPHAYAEYDSADPSDLNARNWLIQLNGLFANASRDYAYENGGSDVDTLGGGNISNNVTYIIGRAIGTGAPTDLHATVGDRQTIDGNAGFIVNSTNAKDTTPTNSTSASVIGGRSDDNFGRRWNGQIAEVIIYTKALTIAEANDVVTYLGDKYGVAVTLF